MGSHMPLPEAVHCTAHPGKLATATCARCGAFRCDACPQNPFFKDHCPACTERLATKPSSRATAAVVVGALSLGCYCPPLAIAALVMGNAELAAIDRGEAPEGGRTYARAGQILGWIGVGLLALIALIAGGAALAGYAARRAL